MTSLLLANHKCCLKNKWRSNINSLYVVAPYWRWRSIISKLYIKNLSRTYKSLLNFARKYNLTTAWTLRVVSWSRGVTWLGSSSSKGREKGITPRNCEDVGFHNFLDFTQFFRIQSDSVLIEMNDVNNVIYNNIDYHDQLLKMYRFLTRSV